jgi:tetratricopeptide (TPR) repeat protein
VTFDSNFLVKLAAHLEHNERDATCPSCFCKFYIQSHISAEYAKAGYVDKAQAYANNIMDPSVKVDTLLINVRENLSKDQKIIALNILDTSIKEVEKIDNVRKRLDVYFSIANLYKKCEKKDKVLETLNFIQVLGDKSTDPKLATEIFSKLAFEYSEIGEPELAYKAASSIDQLTFASESFIDAAKIYMQKGQKDKIDEIIKRLKGKVEASENPMAKVLVLTDIAMFYAEQGLKNESVKMLQDIETEITKTIEPMFRSKPYVKVTSCYIVIGDYDKALAITKLIKENAYQSLALRDTAMAFAKAGLFDKAMKTTESIARIPEKSIAEAMISYEYQKAGKINESEQLLKKALKDASSTENVIDKTFALGEIAKSYIENKQYDLALSAAQLIDYESDKYILLNEIATKSLESKEIELAIKIAGLLKSNQDKTYIMSHVACEYLKIGKNSKASNIISDLVKIATNAQDNLTASWILDDVTWAYISAGKTKQAKQYLDNALELAQNIGVNGKNAEKKCPKADILVVTGGYYLKLGDEEKAKAIFNEALDIPDTIAHNHPKPAIEHK